MENPKILVVEDVNSIEIDVRNRLEEMGYEVQSIVLSAEKAYQEIENGSPDIVLMDLNLEGEKDGVNAAAEIIDNYEIPVLFLAGETNKEKLKRIESSKARGFLSKPFKETDLDINIRLSLQKNKGEQKTQKKNNQLWNLKTESISREQKFIFIRVDYKLKKINLEEILYIEALKDYVVIHTVKYNFTTHTTMKKMIETLPEDEFVRIHRSYIVRLDKIFSVKYPDLIIEEKKDTLPIGGNYRKALFNHLNIV